MKILKIIPCLLITGILLGCESETLVSPDNNSDQITSADLQSTAAKANINTKSSTDVVNATTGEVLGESTLQRNGNGLIVNFKTTGLMPGHAYTLWWVVWNKPENCATPGACVESDFANALNVEMQLLYAARSVAENNGKGKFSAHLKENDDSGSIHELFGLPSFGGLQDAGTAEIHAVLRSHGPKISGQVNEQINNYEGGVV